MIIGIDIDDTISDTYEVMVNYAQEYTANVLKQEPIMNHIENCATHFYTKEIHNWEDGQDLEFLKLYYEKILNNIKPKTLAKEYITKLQEEGHKIILITARWTCDFFDVRETTKRWIEENCIPYHDLVVNAGDKRKVAKEKNIDLFIDDSFKNCAMVADSGIKTYLMDTRVNRGLEKDNIERVYSWPHIYWKLNVI